MTASITNNGDGTLTITFEYTAPSQKIQDLGEDAAHQIFNQTPPRWTCRRHQARRWSRSILTA